MLALLLALASVQDAHWYKGNTHAHTLWDNGDALPEEVVDWYRDHGYDFVVLSDHDERNSLSGTERWVEVREPKRFEELSRRLPAGWFETRDVGGRRHVRLTSYSRLRTAFEPGCFVVLPGEEIGDAYQGKLVHHNVVNLERIILPPGGRTLREVLSRAGEAATDASSLVHLNHPNLGWAVGADDVAAVVSERFFEVYNGHPSARNEGDATHPGTEEMWDRVLTQRLSRGPGPLLYGVASDDAHHYGEKGTARPGRGWIMVRSEELTGEALVRAMKAGDFYATTGVTLSDVRADARGLSIKVEGENGIVPTVRFIGSGGKVLREVQANEAAYPFRPDDLYVRAVVTSSRGTAWVQPVVGPGSRKAELPVCADGWKLEVVAQAPRVRHPSVVCAAPDGRVFVGEDPIDMEGPIDQPVDRVLCLHPDGRVTVFAEGLGPVFGLMYLDGRLFVQHVPKFSVFRDDDGVGRDRIDLIECTHPAPSAGNGLNDHIPANFHLAMDGYLYVSVGQKGIPAAVGRDGRRFEMREGGILRMRPDATELEIYARGVRNVMDVAIRSDGELFAYDNDDHTKTWKVKLLHMVEGGYYGFPWDIKPARRYTLPGVQEFSGGAPTGVLAYTEDALPPEFADNLFLCDWGRRTVQRVRLEREGATWRVAALEDVLRGPNDFRPVGIAVAPDGRGFYVSDWNFAGWKQNTPAGRLFKLTWTGASRAAPKPSWFVPSSVGTKVDVPISELLPALGHSSESVRLAAQRRIVERGAPIVPLLAELVENPRTSPIARRHALWALDALDPQTASTSALKELAEGDLRIQALRQLGTRRVKAASAPVAALLRNALPEVRFQAATALGRIGNASRVPDLLALLEDSDVFIRHAAFTALHRIGLSDPKAWRAIGAGLRSSSAAVREGALFALRETYDAEVAALLSEFVRDGGIAAEIRAPAVGLLVDLRLKPAPWDGRWWRNGPYAFAEDNPSVGPRIDKTVEWEGTSTIVDALAAIREDRDLGPVLRLAEEAARPPMPPSLNPAPRTALRRPVPPKAPVEAYAEFATRHQGDATRGKAVFIDADGVGCVRCHRVGGPGGSLGPDLAGVGAKYDRAFLIESILNPSRQIAEGYAQTLVRTRDGQVFSGLVRAETAGDLVIVDAEGQPRSIRKSEIEVRKISEQSLMPDNLQAALTLEEFADLVSFLASLQDSDGFVPLLNGKDLTGWKKDPANEGHWTIKEGGTLWYDARGTDLWTEKSYANFVLKVDWRFPPVEAGGRPFVEKEAPVILPDGSVSDRKEKVLDGGDSGIFLRGSPKSQVNLWCWPIGSGEIYGYRTDAKLAPEVRAAATPKVRADRPPGQWNQFVITLKGDRITVVLNDLTVIDNAQLPSIPAKGPIGLQKPGNPLTRDMPVEFAHLRIKELP